MAISEARNKTLTRIGIVLQCIALGFLAALVIGTAQALFEAGLLGLLPTWGAVLLSMLGVGMMICVVAIIRGLATGWATGKLP